LKEDQNKLARQFPFSPGDPGSAYFGPLFSMNCGIPAPRDAVLTPRVQLLAQAPSPLENRDASSITFPA